MPGAISLKQMIAPIHAEIGILVAFQGVPDRNVRLTSGPPLEIVGGTIVDKEEMVDPQRPVIIAKETHPVHFVAQTAYKQDIGWCDFPCVVKDGTQGPPGFPRVDFGANGFWSETIELHDPVSTTWHWIRGRKCSLQTMGMSSSRASGRH